MTPVKNDINLGAGGEIGGIVFLSARIPTNTVRVAMRGWKRQDSAQNTQQVPLGKVVKADVRFPDGSLAVLDCGTAVHGVEGHELGGSRLA